MQSIVFLANGERYEAEISDSLWPRSLIGPDHLVVEHPSESYVIDVGPEGFTAYPVLETA